VYDTIFVLGYLDTIFNIVCWWWQWQMESDYLRCGKSAVLSYYISDDDMTKQT